jgi:tRNA threonylcarbamoyladenosine biosynthesis protein TsaE
VIPLQGGRDLPDVAATQQLANEFAQGWPASGILLIDGPLGAGKTTFVAAFARALGSDAAVSSPTYVLVHEYPTDEGPILHGDAYRIESADIDALLGWEEIERARAVVIEWGARVATAFPTAWRLRLERRDGGRRAEWTAPCATP